MGGDEAGRELGGQNNGCNPEASSLKSPAALPEAPPKSGNSLKYKARLVLYEAKAVLGKKDSKEDRCKKHPNHKLLQREDGTKWCPRCSIDLWSPLREYDNEEDD